MYDIGKFNRYAKIGLIADDLVEQFKSAVRADWESLDARSSFACLIMMQYGIRVGNEDSAIGHKSGLKHTESEFVQTFGTTTLLNKHVDISKDKINLHFIGKTEVEHNIDIDDSFVVKYARLYHRPEQLEEKWLGIDYDALFKFIKNNVGGSFIPKDFRTFCANVTAWKAIKRFLDKPKRKTKTEANKEIRQVTEIVASRLGNTPSISKSNYIDRRMLDWFKVQRLDEEI